MRAATIVPTGLFGELAVQPSKSASHRMAVCAALAGTADLPAAVDGMGDSDDIKATINALSNLGFALKTEGARLLSRGRTEGDTERTVDCGESGSTLRFLLPLALDGNPARFTGRGKLLSRPMKVYETICKERGIHFEYVCSNGEVTAIDVAGKLTSGVFDVPGDVSSQFVSGLMFALFSLDGDSEIRLTTPLESKGYVDLTVQTLSHFGVDIKSTPTGYFIRGNQKAKPKTASVEADWSHAAFFLVGGAAAGDVKCSGLSIDSAQGDKAILDVLKAMGADAGFENGCAYAKKSALRGCTVDAAQIPDLVPIIAVAACAAKGETRIINAARLRIKESDRLFAMQKELATLGANIKETADGLVVRGTGRLKGGQADSHNDHRVAMSLAVAASLCEAPVTVINSAAVSKSAPNFYDEMRSLGSDVTEVEL